MSEPFRTKHAVFFFFLSKVDILFSAAMTHLREDNCVHDSVFLYLRIKAVSLQTCLLCVSGKSGPYSHPALWI